NRRIEVDALCSDGRLIPVELTVVIVPGLAPPVFTAYVRDLSERKRAERERNLFLAALGHDLRSPLSVIRLSSHILLRSAPSDAIARTAARIELSADRMNRLIGDLLDFARTQAG